MIACLLHNVSVGDNDCILAMLSESNMKQDSDTLRVTKSETVSGIKSIQN